MRGRAHLIQISQRGMSHVQVTPTLRMNISAIALSKEYQELQFLSKREKHCVDDR